MTLFYTLSYTIHILFISAEMELHQRLKPSGSLSSGFSRSTSATQTHTSNGTSISTQTLDSVGRDFDDMDVQL